MSLYAWINFFSILVPLIASFHPRIKFYKHWKAIVISIFLSLTPFIIWDIWFTNQGYWGFTANYLSDIYLVGLPLEEWLFFVCIPYACMFTHHSLLTINPHLGISELWVKRVTYSLLLLCTILIIAYQDLSYSFVNSIFAISIMLIVWFYERALLKTYYLTFLVMLIPFFIVNGILTGTGIPDQIVWYNAHEMIGIRLGSIPIEDVGYAFSLILLNLFLFEKIKRIIA